MFFDRNIYVFKSDLINNNDIRFFLNWFFFSVNSLVQGNEIEADNRNSERSKIKLGKKIAFNVWYN